MERQRLHYASANLPNLYFTLLRQQLVTACSHQLQRVTSVRAETIPSGSEFNSTALGALEDLARWIFLRNVDKPERNSTGMNPAKEKIEPIPGSKDEPVLPENAYESIMHSS